MDPVQARFPGVCARTGKPYEKGALIVKVKGNKWALAQDRKGNIKVAPDWRLCVLDGKEQTLNLNLIRIGYCACVKERPDFAAEKSAAGDDARDYAPWAAHRWQPDGADFVCRNCGRTVHIVTDAELAERQAEAQRVAYEEAVREVHFVEAAYGWLELSHRLPPEKWALVAEHFRYWSHDDLDEMDYFDMPGGWYLLGDPPPSDVILNGAPTSSPSRAERVEEILGIRPENRLAALRVKWEQDRQEAQARARAKRELDAAIRREFDWKDGEYLRGEKGQSLVLQGEQVNIGEGQTIYGTGEWFVVEPDGLHVWHVTNNGMDGDDWSRNNIRTGGAGAVGFRFPMTPERQAVLDTLRVLQTKKGEAKL